MTRQIAMKNICKHILTVYLPLALLAGCSTTKRLAESEVLYTGVKKMEIEMRDGEKVPSPVKSAVKDPLSVKPNNPLYSPYVRTPLPIGLWFWNYFYTERTTGFRAWVYRSFAKQPVLISDVKPDLRTGLVEDILDNYGYFGSWASYELIPKKNPKKARLSYHVDIADPWFYSSVEYPECRCPVTAVIDSLQISSPLQPGAQYNIDSLTNERIRITNYLRNRSYYYFRPDYLEYLADTTRSRYRVDLRMVMAQGIPGDAIRSYDIGEKSFDLFNPVSKGRDTTYIDGMEVRHDLPLKIRPKVLRRMMTVREGDPAGVDAINKTLDNLTSLGIFRYVNLMVTPLDSIRGADNIDLGFSGEFDKPLSAEFEVDFASKSNSFLGPGAIFSVRHKNLFRGGEVLSVRLNGSYEWQTGNNSQKVNAGAINSYELGVNASLIFPRILAPRLVPRPKKYPSKTTFNLGANILNRPDFFTMGSFNFYTSYDFQTSSSSSHNLTLFRFVYNHLLRTTESFDSTVNRNPAIYESFRDQFIPSASYTFTADRKVGKNHRDRIIWQTTATTAGNIFASGWGATGHKVPKKIFGNQFSQFVKGVTELKFYKAFGQNSTLVSRLNIGVGYAYGNSTVLPYSEQFYVGGANSIRAFTVRSVGPGSYVPDESDVYGYFDQTGDIKLEANLEYRFGILGRLSGAVFVDAGNIWLIRSDPERPGGRFHLKNLGRELATGTGAGLRYDISYLVIRADLGIGIHLPYDTGKSGYYNIPRFKDGLGFHLAIGYPF
ncbi:MAG: BamA/TamA family outer membrane protein [Alistipes sp.]|nr:BamA/TamA family outer membrane protein [Alistipes sp.]